MADEISVTLSRAQAAALRDAAAIGVRGLAALEAIQDTTAARSAIGKVRDGRARNPLSLTRTEAAALIKVASAGAALGLEYGLIAGDVAELAREGVNEIRANQVAR